MRDTETGQFSFICPRCGEPHIGLPDIAFASPIFWNQADADAEPTDNRLNSDFCIIDGEHYFIRCVLDLPIRDTDEVFGWGVWVTQSKSNFDLYGETFDATPERQTFGYLATNSRLTQILLTCPLRCTGERGESGLPLNRRHQSIRSIGTGQKASHANAPLSSRCWLSIRRNDAERTSAFHPTSDLQLRLARGVVS